MLAVCSIAVQLRKLCGACTLNTKHDHEQSHLSLRLFLSGIALTNGARSLLKASYYKLMEVIQANYQRAIEFIVM